MRSAILITIAVLCLGAPAQTTGSDQALLTKTRHLYDFPFERGLINFDCAINFSMKNHFVENFGQEPPATAQALINALQEISYRVLVDTSGATVSPQAKLPDLSAIAHAADVEQANEQLLQAGLSNWEPFAAGSIIPLRSTNPHFEKASTGYSVTMNGAGVDGVLQLDEQFRLLSGVIKKPQNIVLSAQVESGPDGFVLRSNSTDTNHEGANKFEYTYQTVDGFQIPATVKITAQQGMHWTYSLSECKTQHGIVMKVGLPKS